jgi:hypothetical protein
MARRMASTPTGTSLKRDEGWYDLRQQDDAPDRRQLFVDADPALDRVAAGWRVGRGAKVEGAPLVPTVAHLPAESDPASDRELRRHLCGMQPTRPGEKGKWKPRGSRHDYLDCLVYAPALARVSRFLNPPTLKRKFGQIGTL